MVVKAFKDDPKTKKTGLRIPHRKPSCTTPPISEKNKAVSMEVGQLDTLGTCPCSRHVLAPLCSVVPSALMARVTGGEHHAHPQFRD